MFKISDIDQDFSWCLTSLKDSKSSLDLTHGDSRVQTYRTYKSTSENQVWIKYTWRRKSTRRLVSRDYEFWPCIKYRLVLITQAHT